MKRILVVLLILALVAFAFSVFNADLSLPISAGGDKVRGENGTGSVVQEGPTPFGVDTPAGPNN